MRLSLNNKILGLVLLLIGLLCALGGMSYWASIQLVGDAAVANERLQDTADVIRAGYWAMKKYQNQADFIINRDPAVVEKFDQSADRFSKYRKKITKIAETAEEKKWARLIEQADTRFSQVFKQGVVPEIQYQNQGVLGKYQAQAQAMTAKIEAASIALAKHMRGEMQISMMSAEYNKVIAQADALDWANNLAVWGLKLFQAQSNVIVNQDLDAVEEYDAALKKMNQYRDKLAGYVKSGRAKKLIAELVQSVESFDALFRDKVVPAVERAREKRLAKLDEQSSQSLAQLGASVEKIVDSMRKKAKEAIGSYEGSAAWTKAAILIIAVAGVFLGLFVGFVVSRSISNPIKRVVGGLDDASSQVAASSGEVSASSTSLADGASQQAASLEQASASLEELNSMTMQNSDNANQADVMMRDASQVVDEANHGMKDLRAAMDRITTASEETGKIIKTIDEIAFQTNLLALNAAVEAARAGEAGAGFAVVADEVRNLAMRAAEAARSTAALIEENIKNIEEGSRMVVSTDEAFDRVAESAAKVAELIGEIASASGEQAQGIGQINKATTEMERVTQQVAASAEETAAAAEELSGQSTTMKDMVAELAGVVSGGAGTLLLSGNGGNKAPRGLLPWGGEDQKGRAQGPDPEAGGKDDSSGPHVEL